MNSPEAPKPSRHCLGSEGINSPTHHPPPPFISIPTRTYRSLGASPSHKCLLIQLAGYRCVTLDGLEPHPFYAPSTSRLPRHFAPRRDRGIFCFFALTMRATSLDWLLPYTLQSFARVRKLGFIAFIANLEHLPHTSPKEESSSSSPARASKSKTLSIGLLHL